MKRLIALFLCITCFTCSSGSLLYADEYVFTEASLRAFLEENIREAVDKVTADLTRAHEVRVAEIDRDHDIEVVLLDQQIKDQTMRADGYEKELKVAGFKLVISIALSAAAGLGVGYMIGNLF